MIVTPIDIPLSLPESPTPRGKGIHQSGILRVQALDNGQLKPEWVEEISIYDQGAITDPTSILRISIGLAWEQWYLPQLHSIGVIDHPGECELDGIKLTPDGESLDRVVSQDGEGYRLIVHEVKATYKSARSFDPDSQWLFMRQLLGYCKVKETRFAMLHVLFICGDYSRPISPKLRVWLLEFSQQEIDASWSQMMQFKTDFLRRYPSGTKAKK